MSSLWHKIFADLLLHKSRTLLAVTSVAIGLFVLGSVLGMIDLQLNKMDESHRLSQPSHISLILKTDADPIVAEQIKTLTGVANVDTLTQFTVRFKTANDSTWQTGTAIFRPDYKNQQYDLMKLSSGQFPEANSIALERLSAKAAGLNIGDSIIFDTDNDEMSFKVNGIIRHPFVKPPTFGGQQHFFISTDTAAFFGIKPNTFRQLLVQVSPPFSNDKARQIAGDIRAKLSTLGINVNATLLQNPGQHWGRPFLLGINLILTVMAWMSLLLSCVLILTTIAALITQQTDQIGIMKSLGASRLAIARIYLTEVLVISLIALSLAVPLSLLGAYYSSRWFLDLFNIEMDSFTYSSRALYLTVASGLILPLVASLFSVWRGVSMSIRQALASYGLGGDFGRSRFDNWLEASVFRALPTLYAVSLGNLFGRKARMLWTQTVLVVAGVLFMVIMSLIKSVNLTLDNELARSRYSVRLGFSADQPATIIQDLTRRLPQTTGLELWNRLPAELSFNKVLLKQSGSLGAQIVALPVETTMYQPLIVSGRWFSAQDNNQNVLVLNAMTAELNHIQVGDNINMNLLGRYNSQWTVIGLYRWFVGTGYSVEPVYAPLTTIQSLTKNTLNSSFALLSANINTLAEEKTFTDALKQKFLDARIKLDIYTTIAKLEQRQFSKNQFRPITSMLLGLASMIASVGAIGLSGTLAIGVMQRRREIGVLRAIGASSQTVFKLFMLEGFFHGLIAWLLSCPIAYFTAEPLAHMLGEIMLSMQLDFSFSFMAVWIWLGLVCVIVLLASYLPASHATRISVLSSLNY